jgi:hypothetical protein
MTRRDFYKDPTFEASAAPEAIEYRLKAERRYLAEQQRRVAWLEELLERRTAERDAGVWPGTPTRTTNGDNRG